MEIKMGFDVEMDFDENAKIDDENFSIYKFFEPLPFYPIEDEPNESNNLKIHLNPNAGKKQIFIPKKTVKVYVRAERQSMAHMIHPFIYTITLTHHLYTWQVNRNFREIKEIHKVLVKLAKSNMGISPDRIPKNQIKPEWPLFPTQLETLIADSQITKHCRHIAQYIEKLLTFPPYRSHPSVHTFLSVSPLSFISSLSPSLIEDLLSKKSGDIQLYGNCIKSRILCQKLKIWYEKRWFCLKDTFIVYLNSFLNYSISFVMLVDCAFECKTTIKANAYHAIEIKNLERRLTLKCKSSHQQNDWFQKITLMVRNSGKDFNDKTLLRYDSFAPNRASQLCRWYVNSSTYMEHIMHALNGAQEEIYIADWWLCPELYLKRPTDDLEYRLDKILLDKAKAGVKVYILLYKEITLVIDLMSLRTRQILTEHGSNPNIKVLRHPDHFFDGVFMWSHHEKFVVIDQTVGFIGGIDLCYGRWDDEYHRLVDLGTKKNVTQIVNKKEPNPNKITVHSQSEINMLDEKENGFQYLNKFQYSQQTLSSYVKQNQQLKGKSANESDLKLIRAFTNAEIRESPFKNFLDTEKERKSKKFIPKGAKDIVIKNLKQTKKSVLQTKPIKNTGKAYKGKEQSEKNDNPKIPSKLEDSSKSAAQNSNYKKPLKWVTNKKDMVRGRKKSMGIFYLSNLTKQKTNLTDDIYDRWHHNSKLNQSFVDIEDIELPKNSDNGYYYWIGKDYANVYKEDFKDVHEYSKDQLDRTETPRMPWRDQGMVVIGHGARDLARHFIQRWNQCKNEQVPLLESYPYLIPKSYTDNIKYNQKFIPKEELFKTSVQILRSVDDWSAGISKTETSILNAYVDLIKNAKHYIYIENQFFITTCHPSKDIIKNNIGKALADRIIIAHKNKQKFRVFIFLPLLPGFDRINAIKAVQYYNLRSIKFGDFSIYKELLKEGITDPSEYITFHGMRNWSVLMGKLVQEIIYVHSKLMIVDDNYVLCGSANINDRSLIGKRDSEVAALVTDEEFVDSVMNKKPFKAGKYALSLREKIFKLHLGVYFENPSQLNVVDCVSDEFYHMFKSISHQNTLVYDEVFKCLPSDNILNFDDLKNYTKKPSLSKTDPNEGKIKMEKFVYGLVVDFPLKFLSHEENFFPDIVTAEGIVPSEIWI